MIPAKGVKHIVEDLVRRSIVATQTNMLSMSGSVQTNYSTRPAWKEGLHYIHYVSIYTCILAWRGKHTDWVQRGIARVEIRWVVDQPALANS